MAFIEGLEEKIQLLNQAYFRELEVRFQSIHESLAFSLLTELASERNLQLHNNPALLRAEVHNPKFVIPHQGFGRALHFKGGFNSDAGIRFGVLDLRTEPITAFMKLAGIGHLDRWIDYQPSWEEYLSLLDPNLQSKVAGKMNQFDLAKLRVVGGDNCTALYWQRESEAYHDKIHSSWLGLKTREELSFRELIWTPRPTTKEEWLNSILRKYNGENI